MIPYPKKKKLPIYKVLTGVLNVVLYYFDGHDNGNVDDGIFLEVHLPSFKEEIGSRIIQSFIK